MVDPNPSLQRDQGAIRLDTHRSRGRRRISVIMEYLPTMEERVLITDLSDRRCMNSYSGDDQSLLLCWIPPLRCPGVWRSLFRQTRTLVGQVKVRRCNVVRSAFNDFFLLTGISPPNRRRAEKSGQVECRFEHVKLLRIQQDNS